MINTYQVDLVHEDCASVVVNAKHPIRAMNILHGEVA